MNKTSWEWSDKRGWFSQGCSTIAAPAIYANSLEAKLEVFDKVDTSFMTQTLLSGHGRRHIGGSMIRVGTSAE